MIATSSPVERILEKLDGVRKAGPRQWEALCPIHEDRRASLSVGEGDDGRVLLTCHAGCQREEIVAALDLKMRDLFPMSNGRLKSEIVATYDYTDEAGKLLFQAVRFLPKKFRQRRPDGSGGWLWNLHGMRRVLYCLPELLTADPMHDVYVVEGEKDVEGLRSRGLVATCNPMGAGKWGKVDHKCIEEALEGRHVVVISDNDDAGRKHAQQVAHSVSQVAASVTVLELPALGKSGDVSDWLDAGGTVEELARLVEESPPWHEGPSHHEGGKGSRKTSRPGAVVRTLSQVEALDVDWLWQNRIPLGAVTILDGDPGLGKSTLTLDLAARVSRGWSMPPDSGGIQVVDAAGVLLLSAEDSLEHTIRPRLDAAGTDVSLVHALEAVGSGENQRPPTLPFDADLIEEIIRDHGVRLVVVDPLMAFLDPDLDAHKDQHVRRAMHRLKLLAEDTGTAVLVVRHLNKLTGGPAIYRGGGSIGITGAARSALVVGRHPQEPGQYVLASVKNNLGPKPPSLIYTHEPAEGVARLGWGGECDLGPEDVIGQGGGRIGQTVGGQAAEAIRKYLASGPVPMGELETALEAVGYSGSAIREGKRLAGVIAKRNEFGGGCRALLPEHEAKSAGT